MKAMLAVAALTVGGAATAQTPALDQARAAGQVAERYDGYLVAGSNASGALRSQVSSINLRRRAIYSNFATSHRVSPQEVGITAGCQLLGRVAVGEAYVLSDGVWRRRVTARTDPRPDYCR